MYARRRREERSPQGFGVVGDVCVTGTKGRYGTGVNADYPRGASSCRRSSRPWAASRASRRRAARAPRTRTTARPAARGRSCSTRWGRPRTSSAPSSSGAASARDAARIPRDATDLVRPLGEIPALGRGARAAPRGARRRPRGASKHARRPRCRAQAPARRTDAARARARARRAPRPRPQLSLLPSGHADCGWTTTFPHCPTCKARLELQSPTIAEPYRGWRWRIAEPYRGWRWRSRPALWNCRALPGLEVEKPTGSLELETREGLGELGRRR